MILRIKILLTIIVLFFTSQSRADTWFDPTWKRMLDSSDVIALIEYTSEGKFKASAKIKTIYKGELNVGDEIWISNFSNRYGPIDKMSKGDKYLVFLNLNKPTEEQLEYCCQELSKDSTLEKYVNAIENKRHYYVWTPTAGDLKIKGKRVEYDLIQTTYYRKQTFYPLKEFEDFLKTYIDKREGEQYMKQLLLKINSADESEEQSQFLMKLYLLGYNSYLDKFEEFSKAKNPSTRYALAKLMENIENEKSRKVLITLLDDKHSIVQGEAVRQLKNDSAEIVAPILLSKLKSSTTMDSRPWDIMNPVMNTIDGGQIEIIKTLGELKYEPAIPDLLLLLDTKNSNLFELVIESLKNIGTKEYIPYFNKHLDNKTSELIFTISRMIAKDSLVECLPSLKDYISTCNRNEYPIRGSIISTYSGIGKFNDSETVKFLLSDYERFFTYKDTLSSTMQKEWTGEYMAVFSKWRAKEAKPLIYKSVYDWFGVNQDFGVCPELFNIKQAAEDSFKISFSNIFTDKEYELSNCIAFIRNTSDVINGKQAEIDYIIEVVIPSIGKAKEHKAVVINNLHLNTKVYIKYSNGSYYERQERFEKGLMTTPLEGFLSFAKAVPDQSDIMFLQALIDNNFITEDYYQKRIVDTIEKIDKALK